MTSYDDLWNRPDLVAWRERVVVEMLPKLEGSQCSLSLLPPDAGDVKFWVELGASIMLDKPLVVVARDDRPVPDKLLFIADEVVRVKGPLYNEANVDLITAALQRVVNHSRHKHDG